MERLSDIIEGIGRGRLDRVAVGKLSVGVDLLEGIRQLARREGIRTGILLSGVGALKKAIFRNVRKMPPDLKVEDRDRVYLELEQPLELLSLSGWIATKETGETEVHAHLSASTVLGDQIVTLGGHLTPGTLTSIKVVVVVGVLEDANIGAALDPRISQLDLTFPAP